MRYKAVIPRPSLEERAFPAMTSQASFLLSQRIPASTDEGTGHRKLPTSSVTRAEIGDYALLGIVPRTGAHQAPP